MAESEQPAAGPDDVAGAEEAAGADALAGAEEAAAREAAAEAARPKVVRPKSKTSRQDRRDGLAGRCRSTVTLARSAGPADGITRLDAVSIQEGGAQVVNATNVDVSRGGIGRAQAVDIAVSQGGIGLARGDRVSVEMGAIGAAIGGEVRVTQGAVGSVLAREVRIEQAAVRTIVANNVRFERTTGVLILLARKVEGDVRVLLDWRGAAAFGVAAGAVIAISAAPEIGGIHVRNPPCGGTAAEPRLYSTDRPALLARPLVRPARSADRSPPTRDRPFRARPRDGGPRARCERRSRHEHLASGAGQDRRERSALNASSAATRSSTKRW